MNTGNKPRSSKQGLYPMVGWKIRDETVFMVEGCSRTGGLLMEWAQEFGIFVKPEDTSAIAESVPDTGGVYFVPAFSGLDHPYWDDSARGALLGLSRGTKKEQVIRALLESLGYRVKDLFNILKEDLPLKIRSVKADGGVTNNNFVMQFSADLLETEIHRASHTEMTSQGVAFLAGLEAGVWKNRDELHKVNQTSKVFQPDPKNMTEEQRKAKYAKWKKAVERALDWEDS